MENNVGIYCWRNVVTNKRYIGQSSNLRNRKLKFQSFKIIKYGGVYINNARQKYKDIRYWEYEVLEYCKLTELDEKEQYYIGIYNTTNPELGYNLTDGGWGHSGYIMDETTKRKIGDAQMGNKNHAYGKSPSNEIKEILREKLKGKNNYMFGKTHSDDVRKIIADCKSIPIYQYDLNTGEIIREWKSAKEAAQQLGFNNSNITACCKGRTNKYKGFGWIYVEDQKDKRKVLQLEINTGHIINEWENPIIIGENFNVKPARIRQCCKNGKTSCGFKWMYKSDYDNLYK